MSSLLPHDLCHGRSASHRPPTVPDGVCFPLQFDSGWITRGHNFLLLCSICDIAERRHVALFDCERQNHNAVVSSSCFFWDTLPVSCVRRAMVFWWEALGFPCVAQLVKSPPAMRETWGLIPGLGRCPGKGKGYPLRYSGLENPMDCTVSPWGRKESDTTEWLSLSHHFVKAEGLVNKENSGSSWQTGIKVVFLISRLCILRQTF